MCFVVIDTRRTICTVRTNSKDEMGNSISNGDHTSAVMIHMRRMIKNKEIRAQVDIKAFDGWC